LSLVSITFLQLALSGGASAQEAGGIDAHGFHLSPQSTDTRSGLVLYRPTTMAAGDYALGSSFEFAKAPLVAQTASGERLVIVDNVLALNLSGAVALHERVRLDVAAPVFLLADGTNGGGAALGDARVASTVVLLAPGNGTPGLGVVPWLDVPSGPEQRFLGKTGMGGGVAAAATLELGDLTVNGNLGAQLNPNLDRGNLNGSDALVIGLGGGYLLSPDLGLLAEVRGSAPFQASASAGTQAPWEGIVASRWADDSGAHVVGGLGTALSPGVGAAAFRVFIGGGFGTPVYNSPAVVADTDADGLADNVDLCPDAPETLNGLDDADGCPDSLPKLAVEATFAGQVMSGATVLLSGQGGEQEVTTPGGVTSRPESVWKGKASLGDCLAGEGLVQMGDVDAMLSIPMEQLGGATLRLVVMDMNGKPLTSAQIELSNEGPGCGVDTAVLIGADGSATIEVGVGKHTVTIAAPGYAPSTEDVHLEAGKVHEVFSLLNAIE
jgi:hypothetical protein